MIGQLQSNAWVQAAGSPTLRKPRRVGHPHFRADREDKGWATRPDNNGMKHYVQTFLLTTAAIISFSEVFLAHDSKDPGPWAAAVLGILLLRRAIISKRQPAIAILSGCLLTALLVAGNHGLLNVNNPAWVVLVILGGICYAFWERIEKLWTY
jgi:hypothetical protein